jgi:hypothetical protein
MSETVDRRNAYYCGTCGDYIATRDVDEGVTPMFLACRVLGDPSDPLNTCDGISRSMMYPERPWPNVDSLGTPIPSEPTWEWYAPGIDEANALPLEAFEHVQRGGLMLRQIPKRAR